MTRQYEVVMELEVQEEHLTYTATVSVICKRLANLSAGRKGTNALTLAKKPEPVTDARKWDETTVAVDRRTGAHAGPRDYCAASFLICVSSFTLRVCTLLARRSLASGWWLGLESKDGR